MTLAKESNAYTRAFAVKGLAALKDRSAMPVLLPLLSSGERSVLIEAVRALGRIGDPSAVQPLLRIIGDAAVDPHVRLEAVAAVGSLHQPAVSDALLDLLADPSPAIRAAALRSLAAFDRESFMTVLSGLDPDPHWSVRAALATVLGTLPAENGLPRLQAMLSDADQRVIPFAIASLVKLKAPSAAALLVDRLKAEDPVVRAAAATALGDLKPADGAADARGGLPLRPARCGLWRPRRGTRRNREVRRRSGHAGAAQRVHRQGLGRARARGDAVEATRPGSGRRRRRPDQAGADDAGGRRLRDGADR